MHVIPWYIAPPSSKLGKKKTKQKNTALSGKVGSARLYGTGYDRVGMSRTGGMGLTMIREANGGLMELSVIEE